MNLRTTLLLLAFTACGPVGTTADGGMALETCDTAGRTCDSAFGNFQMEMVPPAGCASNWTTTSFTVSFGLFDAGTGSAVVSGIPSSAVRQGARP